eukprot:TRINITY_DN58458_c0_g1_i1.p1 TRINITY_DN58458_c0_g1~~TRINITY_DN58458_c0_g1_i1.p1  ORF type:complete len:167 (+),score=37.21 TRINITY_DN58458_c0_g1_i1:135-635(+)
MPINFAWFDLAPFANPYFVETGFFHGEGAMKARSSGHFQRMLSVEVNGDLVARAQEKFRLPLAAGLLEVIQDDSANIWEHIKDLQELCTFFLDAHGYWVQEVLHGAADDEARAESKDPSSQGPCPLLEGLVAIARHALAKKLTVLIDDRRCLQPDWKHPTQTWWRG